MWAFVDHLVQQVSIQTLEGDPDIAVLQMDVDKCSKVKFSIRHDLRFHIFILNLTLNL